MKRYHYAAGYPFGAGMADARTGRIIRRIFRFETKAERDAWVYDGSPYQSRGDYREAVTLRQIQPELRRAQQASPTCDPIWDEAGQGEVLQ